MLARAIAWAVAPTAALQPKRDNLEARPPLKPFILVMSSRLLPELWDKIFAEMDEEYDVVNVASVCQLFGSLADPYHTEYRNISTGDEPIPHVWAHLARRPGLAGHIRGLQIAEYGGRYPTTLIDHTLDRGDEHESPAALERNVVKSLQSMTRLVTLIVDLNCSTFPSGKSTFRAISKLDTLVELIFDISSGVSPGKLEPLYADGIEWDLPNLKSFGLRMLPTGEVARNLGSFIKSFPTLEILKGPDGLLRDPSIRLPNLKQVEILPPNPSSQPRMVVCDFLSNHPSIEELRWIPGREGDIVLSAPFLPNLRRLWTGLPLFQAMEYMYNGQTDLPRWKLSGLSAGVSAADLVKANCLDGSALTGYECPRPSREDFQKMGQLFPNITWLLFTHQFNFPSFTGHGGVKEQNVPLEDWLDVLPSFQKLQRLQDDEFYAKISWDDKQLSSTLLQLATLCPKFNEISGYFCRFDNFENGSELSGCVQIVRKPLTTAEEVELVDAKPEGFVVSNGHRMWYEVRDQYSGRVWYSSKDNVTGSQVKDESSGS